MRQVICLATLVVLEALVLGVTGLGAVDVMADLVVFDEALGSGWGDWSWSTSVDLAATGQVHSGAVALSATFDAAWAGLYLGRGSSLPAADYLAVRFWIHGGDSGGQQMRLMVYEDGGSNPGEVTLGPLAAGWVEHEISLVDLGGPATIAGLVWQDSSGGAQSTFYLDEITLVENDLPPTPTPTPGQGPTLSIDAAAGRRAISPFIYGMNFADEELAEELRLPVRRWGGNSTSRFNWQLDVQNRAMDWYYENITNNTPDPGQLPDGSVTDLFVEQDRRTGTRSMLTMPLMGYTPKARQLDCGFRVSVYGPQQDVDPWQPDCGNGIDLNGDDIVGNDPADTSVVVGVDFVDQWIDHLISRYGSADQGGVRFYELDNEPMLWFDTHRDVHPEPTSYDEMRDRSWLYGAAVRAADPSARIVGPSLWGWTAYFWSALDWDAGGDWWNNPPDRLAHGDVPFGEWYLQQMAAYELSNGERILDLFDLHFYPPGVALSGAGSAATQALRLRSTRLLWDDTYAEESWIAAPVYLVPRMQQMVDSAYPDTFLAITEYNWGALDHLNGALAQADVLGIFGREGLYLATLWGPPQSAEPGAFAFRAYRNYDGAGSTFGEAGVQAASADQGLLSVYAAERICDGALTVVAVNKSDGGLTSEVQIAGFEAEPLASAFTYSAADLGAIVQGPDVMVVPAGFEYGYPAQSITVMEIPLDAVADLPGDCGADRWRTTADILAQVAETFDSDGVAAGDVGSGAHAGDPAGCDPAADTIIDAADLSCQIKTLTLGPGLCD